MKKKRKWSPSVAAWTNPHRNTKYIQITLKYAWTLELCTTQSLSSSHFPSDDVHARFSSKSKIQITRQYRTIKRDV